MSIPIRLIERNSTTELVANRWNHSQLLLWLDVVCSLFKYILANTQSPVATPPSSCSLHPSGCLATPSQRLRVHVHRRHMGPPAYISRCSAMNARPPAAQAAWHWPEFPLTWKALTTPRKLLEFYVRPGIFGMISRFTLVLTLCNGCIAYKFIRGF